MFLTISAIDYQGYVLTAVADTACEITFAIKTSDIRPAEIDIPLQFCAPGSVRLFVNDDLIPEALHLRLLRRRKPDLVKAG